MRFIFLERCGNLEAHCDISDEVHEMRLVNAKGRVEKIATSRVNVQCTIVRQTGASNETSTWLLGIHQSFQLPGMIITCIF